VVIVNAMELKQKFLQFNSKINLLLSAETPIRDIKPHREIPIELFAGQKALFKLHVKKQQIPLQIRIIIQKGINCGNVLLSNKFPRPTIANCDKFIPMKLREVYGTYIGTKSKENLFMDDYVFITIDAEKELTCLFKCAFGRGFLLSLIKLNRAIKKND